MASRNIAVTKVSPLSAFRVGLAMSIVGLIAWLIAVAVLYLGMDAAGVWAQVNSLVADVGGEQVITFGLVMSVAAVLGAISTIFTAILAPLAAVVYNAIVDLFGGLEVGTQEEAS